jgi:hypothetical protein
MCLIAWLILLLVAPSLVMLQNKLAARFHYLLQRYLALAILVLVSHLDLFLSYQTFNLWVLLCTPRKGGQILFAQYDKKDICLNKQSD